MARALPLVAALALAALFRFHDLSADPSPLKRYGDVSDEAIWAHGPRLHALGVPRADDLYIGEAIAPLMTLLQRAAFEGAGVSFASLHLPPAIAGTLLVALLGAFAAAAWGPRCGVIAAGLAAIADAAVIYSRLSIPEMAQALFLMGALLALLRPSRWGAAAAGVAFGFALVTKVTAAYYGPGVLAVLWYTRRGPGAAPGQSLPRSILECAAGGVLVLVPWFALWFWPDRAAYLETIRAVASYDTNGKLISVETYRIFVNYYLGFPSVALLSVTTAMALGDRRLVLGDRTVTALLLWIACFFLAIALSSDKADRRFVPLFAPLVLVAARVLDAGVPWTWSRRGAIAAGAAVPLTAYSAWHGSLANAFGSGVHRTLALLALLAGLGGLLVYLHDRGRRRLGWVGFGVAAAVFTLPSLASLIHRTHTLEASSRALGEQVGEGTLVGPLGHLLAMEARFYPIFYTPGAHGADRINAGFDVTRFDYQLDIPSIASAYGPVGHGRPGAPIRVAEIGVLPTFLGAPRWRIDVYRLPRGR